MGRMPYDDLDAAREFQNYYWNCIRDSDRHLMALLKGLEASGELDRTVILFTSDHGEYLGAYGLRGKGVTPYREASQVPFVIVHPEGRKGAAAEDPVSLIDIAPTLLSMAGVSRERLRGLAPGLTGADISAPVSTGSASPRAESGVLMHWTGLAFQDSASPARFKDVFKMHLPWRVPAMLNALRQTDWSKRGQMRALYDGRYKFARYFAPDDYHRPEDWISLSTRNDLELFDTAADPDEAVNLAGDDANRDLVLALNARLNTLTAAEIGPDDGGFLPFFVSL
jgi:arylsulfatase